ncbi:hypothetical protein, partial [Bradyrhizobium canariense]|uniref:hypothetical protein n=1 Tax=Bradyrhizobium canariense TaxID=255045 RepID=UPI001AECFD3F
LSKVLISQKRQGASPLRTCELTTTRHSLGAQEPVITRLSLVVICLLALRMFDDVETPGKTGNRTKQTSALISR